MSTLLLARTRRTRCKVDINFLWGVQQMTALVLAILAGNPYNIATLQRCLIALPITAQIDVPLSNIPSQAETSVRRRNSLVPLLDSIAAQHTRISAAQHGMQSQAVRFHDVSAWLEDIFSFLFGELVQTDEHHQ